MTREAFAFFLEYATNALADIATMTDISVAQRKALRVYTTVRKVWEGPGPDDDAQQHDDCVSNITHRT